VEKKATKKEVYERPTIAKERKMEFPLRLIIASGKKVVCNQCSSCHGCR
jgi:hypothetical protein